MPKRFFIGFFVVLGLTFGLVNLAGLANATGLTDGKPINKKTTSESFSKHAQESSAHSIDLPEQNESVFSAQFENELWIKTAFGEDFHHFYIQKVKNKKRKPNALKMDFDLGYLSKSTTKVDKSHNTYVEVNKTRIETLDVPDMQFADDIYPWNGANISIVKMGSDYQHYVDDEISAGQTYKEFWDGEETTEFEDFIDEHFGFHDSALIRYLVLLAGILFIIVAYIFKSRIMQLINPD
jgi:hypothetical protein